ncbi:MAG: hypothetical protein N2504_01025 [candidate division WOR-3 bacterium]|nr:hypothetical protein [candidate division WOR-3 bacterium]MCX7947157.1 hypothetical protein [candidate division WOR-3 bacterium]MDW8150213.1 hypothetical protein [candidate division WOR-3 bacterium]
MHYIIIFLIFSFACSKKSSDSQQNPPFSKYDILTYWGYGIGKTHKYYTKDSLRVIISPSIDSTYIRNDTMLKVIGDTFGNLNVVFSDSFYLAQIKRYDTFFVYSPFVADSVKSINFIRDTIKVNLEYKIFKAPLQLNEIWTPIEAQSRPVNDTIIITNQQIQPCSLRIYFDSLKIDSSKKVVIETGNDSTYKLFSKTHSKIKYRYQTKPQSNICSDTTIKKDTAYLVNYDTTYLKAYTGIVRYFSFDSLTASALIGPIPIQVNTKNYTRRIKVQ